VDWREAVEKKRMKGPMRIAASSLNRDVALNSYKSATLWCGGGRGNEASGSH
jgi:hypothetical protein